MAADINDKLKKYKSRFSTTLSTGIGTGTSDTLTPATVTGLPTDTAVTLFIDRVDSTGTKTPSKLEAIKGVISGGNLTSYVRAVEGTEQAHSGGAVVEMVWNAADWNDMVDWGLEEHNQDGTHKSALVTTLKATSAEVATGTDDTKIVTPKALKDAGIVASSAVYPRGYTWYLDGTSVVADEVGAKYIAPQNMTVTKIMHKTVSGTATIRLQKGTTDIDASISVTSSVASETSITSAAITAGDVITLDITAASSCVGLTVCMECEQ